MDIDTWANLIHVPEKMNLRTPGSKHQKKIREILYVVGLAKDHPKESLKEKLFKIEQIPCEGDSRFVAYCRYLQATINVLRNEGN